jgi:hypothetical protein
MALGWTQPLTEMRTIPGGKWRPLRNADLIAICESIAFVIIKYRGLRTCTVKLVGSAVNSSLSNTSEDTF